MPGATSPLDGMTLHLRTILQAGLLLLLLGTLPANSQTDGIHVIANKQLNITSLSIKELRAMFTMRLREWPGQQPVRVFVLKQDNATHIAFCKDILNVYPHQLQAGWDRLVYSGTGTAPETLQTEQEMLEAVARTPGAIGYIKEGTPHENVSIIVLQ